MGSGRGSGHDEPGAVVGVHVRRVRGCPERSNAIRVAVADGELLTREGLASLLANRGFDVVGQVADAAMLRNLVRTRDPHLVIIDRQLSPLDVGTGRHPVVALRTMHPGLGVLVLSPDLDVAYATGVLAAGAGAGFLLKSSLRDPEDLVDAVDRVTRGASVMEPEVIRVLAGLGRRRDPLADLTPRERDVLELMASGLSNLGVARRLFLAEGTVEKHVRHVFTKLDLHHSIEDHRRVLAVLTLLRARPLEGADPASARADQRETHR